MRKFADTVSHDTPCSNIMEDRGYRPLSIDRQFRLFCKTALSVVYYTNPSVLTQEETI